MKRYFHTIVLASLAISITSCDKKAPQAAQGAMPYKVIEVPTQNVTAYSSFPTTLQGKVNSNVRPKITGYIEELYVDEGAMVKKGQPLFRIETNILNQNADAAKAAISTAQAQVNVAQVNVDKLIPLVDKGIVSKVQLETAKATLESAKSQVVNARAQYNSIIANIDFAIVKSPIDGRVGSIPFRQGTLVSPQDQTPLTVVSDEQELFAYFAMSEGEYFNFLENTPGVTLKDKLDNLPEVELVLANGQKYASKGKIETITGQVNVQTGTVQVRAAFPNKEHLLSNGNSGFLLLPKQYNDVLVVPQSSTFEQQGQTFVYKVENDTAKATLITVSDNVNNLSIVKDGLKKGETIVGTGLGTLRSGTPITPQPVEFKSINDAIKQSF
ncbi:efflux RND transporter periplasmic adaptor subunit [Myroides sp. LJL115]